MVAINRPARAARKVGRNVGARLAEVGAFLVFAMQVLEHTLFDVMRHRGYRKEVVRQISDVVVGPGALVAGSGMVFVVGAMSVATGATVGIEGFNSLRGLGAESFTGLVASFGNTREVAPIIFGVALAAQVGAGFTAELGAKRISDEIDALDVMGIPSIVYLVCTRLVATMVALLPLYLIALFASFWSSKFVTTQFLGQSPGIYDHYFQLYLPPIDIIYSMVKVAFFTVIVVLIHCYYGYNASGGPAGVGVAVGKAIRMSIVTIVVVNLFLSFLFWGTATTVSLTG